MKRAREFVKKLLVPILISVAFVLTIVVGSTVGGWKADEMDGVVALLALVVLVFYTFLTYQIADSSAKSAAAAADHFVFQSTPRLSIHIDSTIRPLAVMSGGTPEITDCQTIFHIETPTTLDLQVRVIVRIRCLGRTWDSGEGFYSGNSVWHLPFGARHGNFEFAHFRDAEGVRLRYSHIRESVVHPDQMPEMFIFAAFRRWPDQPGPQSDYFAIPQRYRLNFDPSALVGFAPADRPASGPQLQVMGWFTWVWDPVPPPQDVAPTSTSFVNFRISQ